MSNMKVSEYDWLVSEFTKVDRWKDVEWSSQQKK